jgi:hypothetical protein
MNLKIHIDASFADHKRNWRMWRLATGVCIGLFFVHEASAVFTISAYVPVRQITMRVGSAGATINDVTFNVTGANISPTPIAVTGTPGGSTPVTSPVGGTEITLTAGLVNQAQQHVTLTVDSSAGMACVSGTGCGTTIIPFTSVSWASYNHGTFPTLDIQDGRFTGASNQALVNFSAGNGNGRISGGSITMSNVLVFQYDNTTIYPSGQYRGRVIYTATMP